MHENKNVDGGRAENRSRRLLPRHGLSWRLIRHKLRTVNGRKEPGHRIAQAVRALTVADGPIVTFAHCDRLPVQGSI